MITIILSRINDIQAQRKRQRNFAALIKIGESEEYYVYTCTCNFTKRLWKRHGISCERGSTTCIVLLEYLFVASQLTNNYSLQSSPQIRLFNHNHCEIGEKTHGKEEVKAEKGCKYTLLSRISVCKFPCLIQVHHMYVQRIWVISSFMYPVSTRYIPYPFSTWKAITTQSSLLCHKSHQTENNHSFHLLKYRYTWHK